MTKRRLVTPEDLFELRFVDAVTMSADGEQIVYEVRTIDVERDTYDSHLWLVAASGAAPRQLTFGPHRNGAAAMSPDGRSLAFVSNRRDKRAQIHLLRLDGGEAERLTDLDGEISALSWSPDGGSIAFAYLAADPPETGHLPQSAPLKKAREAKERKDRPQPTFIHATRLQYKFDGRGFLPRAFAQVQVLDLKSRGLRALTAGDYHHALPAWSPDGKWIAVVANRSPEAEYTAEIESDLWLYRAAGGEPRNLTPQPGIAYAPAWSPDSQSIAFVGHQHPEEWWGVKNHHVWVVPIEHGEPRNLTPGFDRTALDLVGSDLRDFHGPGAPVWSRDGGTVYFLAAEHGSTRLFAVPQSGGTPRSVTQGSLEIAAVTGAPRTGHLAVIRCGHCDAGTVARLDPATGSLQDLARPNGALFDSLDLVEPEEIWVDAPQGHRVQGWLLEPGGTSHSKRHPMLLEIHGGPHIQYGACYFHEFQMLASAGFYVLFSNPRGSQGYGEEFAGAITRNWGEPAHEDLMLVVDEALRRHPEIDPKRLGVTGGSYGGYMTNWVVGHTDRFKAALTQRCVTTIPTLMLSDDSLGGCAKEFGAEPWQESDLLRAQSPLTYVENIRTPIMILHSLGDLRCSVSEGEMLYKALKLLRRDVELVLFPEESHGLSRGGTPSRRVARLHVIRDWFIRHLEPDGTAPGAFTMTRAAEPALAGSR